MAKSSRVKAAARRAAPGKPSGLLTAAERKLLAASEPANLARLTPGQAQALLAQTRGSRNKWRDLLTGQSRVQKRKAPAAAGANARSREKADLFDAAVRRIEAHTAAAAGPGPAAGAAVFPAKKSPGKKSRTAGHRQTRAGVRAEMAARAHHLNVAKKPAGRAAAAVRTVRPAAAAKPAADAPAVAPAARGSAPVVTVEATRLARKNAVKKASAAQAVRFDRASQRGAQAAAKKARLTVGGRTTRLSGHLLASGKRAQARRDRKGR
jgi:hypothetical protein